VPSQSNLTRFWRGVCSPAFLLQSEKVENTSYVVQRISGALKQVIVGLGTLATGVFGVTALGMLLLSLRVGAGVVSGELDPSPSAAKATKRSKMNFDEVMASIRNQSQAQMQEEAGDPLLQMPYLPVSARSPSSSLSSSSAEETK
jgi:hypothetical protein